MGLNVVWELVAFGVGLLLGSFLNVCISRLPYGESVVRPRSYCPGCLEPIAWYDNVPLLSWLALRARCRDCGARISWRYPAIELATALWFAFCGALLWLAWFVPGSIAVRREFNPAVELTILAAGTAVLGFLLIGLVVMDWQTRRLPDAFTLTGIAIGFALTCVRAWFLAPGEGDIAFDTTHQLRMTSPGSFQARGNVFMTGTEAMVLGRVAAIVGAALILLVVRWGYKWLRGRDGMGLGDVKLLAMIAAFLGFWGAVVGLFVGVMAACVYALVLLAMRKANAQTKLAFGSFLAVGGLFAAVWGERVVGWYSGLLR